MSKFERRERCLDGRKLNWLNALAYPCRPLNVLKSNSGLRVSLEARQRLRVALEEGGVEFIDENGGGSGVRFHKLSKQKGRK